MCGHTVASLGPVTRPDVRGMIEDLCSGKWHERSLGHMAIHV